MGKVGVFIAHMTFTTLVFYSSGQLNLILQNTVLSRPEAIKEVLLPDLNSVIMRKFSENM